MALPEYMVINKSTMVEEAQIFHSLQKMPIIDEQLCQEAAIQYTMVERDGCPLSGYDAELLFDYSFLKTFEKLML